MLSFFKDFTLKVFIIVTGSFYINQCTNLVPTMADFIILNNIVASIRFSTLLI